MKSDSWVTIESKDPRVTNEIARALPVLGREDTGASTALAVADYNGQRVLVKQRRRFPDGAWGHLYRPEIWLLAAITIFLVYIIIRHVLAVQRGET